MELRLRYEGLIPQFQNASKVFGGSVELPSGYPDGQNDSRLFYHQIIKLPEGRFASDERHATEWEFRREVITASAHSAEKEILWAFGDFNAVERWRVLSEAAEQWLPRDAVARKPIHPFTSSPATCELWARDRWARFVYQYFLRESLLLVHQGCAQLPCDFFKASAITVDMLIKGAADILAAVNMDAGASHRQAAPTDTNSPDYIDMDQAAALVNRSKKTLERQLEQQKMPAPDVEGGGGKKHEWKYSTIKPWLESTYGKPLPPRPPHATR